MPTLHIDDAIEHLVGYLREEITKPPPRMPVVLARFAQWWPTIGANLPIKQTPAWSDALRNQQTASMPSGGWGRRFESSHSTSIFVKTGATSRISPVSEAANGGRLSEPSAVATR